MTSYIDFGTPDTSTAVTDSPTVLTSKADEYEWYIPVNGFKWSSNSEDTTEYKFKTFDNDNTA